MDKKFALWFIEMYLRKVEALNSEIILRSTACTLDSEEDPDLLSASQFLNQGHHDDLKRRNPWLHAPRKDLYNEQVTQPLSVRQYFDCLEAPYPKAVFEYLESAYAPLEEVEEKCAVAPLAKLHALGARASGFIRTAWNTFPSQLASISEPPKESTSAPATPSDNPEPTTKRLGYLLQLHGGHWNLWTLCSIIVVVGILGMFSYVFLDPLLIRARVHRYPMRDGSLSVWLEMMRQKSWTCVRTAFVLCSMLWEGCELFCIVSTFDIFRVCYDFTKTRLFPDASRYLLRIVLLKSSFDSSQQEGSCFSSSHPFQLPIVVRTGPNVSFVPASMFRFQHDLLKYIVLLALWHEASYAFIVAPVRYESYHDGPVKAFFNHIMHEDGAKDRFMFRKVQTVIVPERRNACFT
jgi:hypothetical protein